MIVECLACHCFFEVEILTTNHQCPNCNNVGDYEIKK